MVDRTLAIEQIDRAVCLRAAEARFSVEQIVDGNVALYR